MIRKKMWIWMLVLLGGSGLLLQAGEQKKDTGKWWDADHEEVELFFLDRLPGALFFPAFLENYSPTATLLNEAGNGFALPDNPKVYFTGDSALDFSWNYNGHNVDSALNPGSYGVMPSLGSMSGFSLSEENPLGEPGGFNLTSDFSGKSGSRFEVSGVIPNMGGMASFAEKTSLNHPLNRADRLYKTRRKITGNFYADFQWQKKMSDADLSLGFTLFNMDRQFNDFNQRDTTYDETGRLYLFDTKYRKKTKRGYWEVFGLVNCLDRSNLGSETGALPQETLDLERLSLLGGLKIMTSRLEFFATMMGEREDRNPMEPDLYKDLQDNDGDGLWPFSPVGRFSSAVLNLGARYRIYDSGLLQLTGTGNVRQVWLKGQEQVRGPGGILFARQPYLGISWSGGSDYSSFNTKINTGAVAVLTLSRRVRIVGNVSLRYLALGFSGSERDADFLEPGADLGIQIKVGKKSRLQLSLGTGAYDLGENLNMFLEPSRPLATLSYWNDANQDQLFQPREAEGLYGYSDGGRHYLDPELKAPRWQRISVQFVTPLSRHWEFRVSGLFKKIRNSLSVEYAGDYGFFDNVSGRELFFLDSPVTGYNLTNMTGFEDPFYGEFRFAFNGKKPEKWLFSFSFMAHIGMGAAGFGNGPGSNDTGIVSEMQASPNSLINAFGRLDGDRAFVARCYFGFFLRKNLFLGASLKYRDGNPFAFIDTAEAYGQRVLYFQTIRAEDKQGRKGGPREGYISDVSLQLTWDFNIFNRKASLSAAVFNLLDFGTELSEYVFSGGSRDAMELMIPRSMRLTFRMHF